MAVRSGTVLHVGSGTQRIAEVHPAFAAAHWREIRVDADPATAPDIVGSITDLAPVADESANAVFSSHSLEHVFPHEVPVALKEFLRVMRPDGFLLITCPDLQEVCRLVAEDKLTDAAYVSPAGPIAPIDMLYGHRASLVSGNAFMAHRCGFTAKVLLATLQAAGFASVVVTRRPGAYSLWALATKCQIASEDAMQLTREFFPG